MEVMDTLVQKNQFNMEMMAMVPAGVFLYGCYRAVRFSAGMFISTFGVLKMLAKPFVQHDDSSSERYQGDESVINRGNVHAHMAEILQSVELLLIRSRTRSGRSVLQQQQQQRIADTAAAQAAMLESQRKCEEDAIQHQQSIIDPSLICESTEQIPSLPDVSESEVGQPHSVESPAENDADGQSANSSQGSKQKGGYAPHGSPKRGAKGHSKA